MQPTQRFTVQSGEVRLAVKTWGNAEGPPLLFVHGYPDNHEIWLPVIERLAARYQLIAYDVRGTGESGEPAGVDGYRLEYLVEDMAAVIDAVSPSRPVHVIAHDWGSVQSWEAVTTDRLKGRIASLTSCSGPSLDHLGFWARARRQDRDFGALLSQMTRSWYIYVFHIPGVAPMAWRLRIGKAWPKMLSKLEHVVVTPHASQLRDGINGLNLYRANFFQRLSNPQERHAHAPVQLIVPLNDPFLSPKIYSDLEQWAPQLWRREVRAGHWFPLTQPDQLADLVTEFVNRIDEGRVIRAPRRGQKRK
jgi:pimeloyl-ACP methyl ester carboxylesterase